jgi:hypothetical protein
MTPLRSTASDQSSAPLCLIDISRVARPFRFVSIANYFMLVACIWGVAATVEAPFTSHLDVSTIVGTLIAMAVFGYAGWVAWHNIGVLNSVLNPHTNRALWVVGIFGMLIALAVLPAFSRHGVDEAAFKESIHDGVPGVDVGVRSFCGAHFAGAGAPAVNAGNEHNTEKLPPANFAAVS